MAQKPRTGPLTRHLAPPTKPVFDMFGRTGLLALGGRIYDEWDLQLQGYRGRRAYREMADQDPTAGAILFALEMLIRQVHWSVKAANATPAAKAAAQFVEECLADMEETWPDTLAEILTMLVYGWSLHEILYKERRGESDDPTQKSKYTDGKVGWRSWAVRAQESLDRWEFDDEMNLLGMWQIPPPDYRIRFVPLAKALLFRPSVRRGNPEGRSLLRNAYRPYYFKKNLETIEAIGVERDAVGYPVIYAPDNVVNPDNPDDQAASDAYLALLENFRRDEQEGALLPNTRDAHGQREYEFELLKSGGARQIDVDKVIGRKATEIAQSVLADFLQLGHNQRGAQALSQSKIQLFNAALGAILDSIAAQANDRAVPPLCRMNAIPAALYPTIEHGEIERADLDKLGAFILALAQAGAALDLSPGSPLLAYLLEEADLPQADTQVNEEDPDDNEEDDPDPTPSGPPMTTRRGPVMPGAPVRQPADVGQAPVAEPGNPVAEQRPPARPPRGTKRQPLRPV